MFGPFWKLSGIQLVIFGKNTSWVSIGLYWLNGVDLAALSHGDGVTPFHHVRSLWDRLYYLIDICCFSTFLSLAFESCSVTRKIHWDAHCVFTPLMVGSPYSTMGVKCTLLKSCVDFESWFIFARAQWFLPGSRVGPLCPVVHATSQMHHLVVWRVGDALSVFLPWHGRAGAWWGSFLKDSRNYPVDLCYFSSLLQE